MIQLIDLLFPNIPLAVKVLVYVSETALIFILLRIASDILTYESDGRGGVGQPFLDISLKINYKKPLIFIRVKPINPHSIGNAEA